MLGCRPHADGEFLVLVLPIFLVVVIRGRHSWLSFVTMMDARLVVRLSLRWRLSSRSVALIYRAVLPGISAATLKICAPFAPSAVFAGAHKRPWFANQASISAFASARNTSPQSLVIYRLALVHGRHTARGASPPLLAQGAPFYHPRLSWHWPGRRSDTPDGRFTGIRHDVASATREHPAEDGGEGGEGKRDRRRQGSHCTLGFQLVR